MKPPAKKSLFVKVSNLNDVVENSEEDLFNNLISSKNDMAIPKIDTARGNRP